VLGGNASTLAVASSFRAPADSPRGGAIVRARLVPLAWTPAGAVVGNGWQNAGIAIAGLFDWIDRTFPPEDERSFVAPMRDVELLVRTGWEAPAPERIDLETVLNVEDLPDDVADALAHPAAVLVQCAACRRLCVQDDFVWREKQLCAWDYHTQVFGKRGPWREGICEERHFATLPACAYVAGPLLAELGVEGVLAVESVSEQTARDVVNALLEREPDRAHLVARTPAGFTVLREA
jgi:hypothetical protein